MKKTNPFISIPTLPTTLNGQWLTFSHMANHYRRLLNAKPRVQSYAPKQSNSNFDINIGNDLRVTWEQLQPKKESSRRKKSSTFQAQTKNRDGPRISKSAAVCTPNKKMRNSEVDHRTMSAAMLNAARNSKSSYEILFGPSSLKSSIDAFNSEDSESIDNQPNITPMGIREKIKLFLDNLHQYNNDSSDQRNTTPTNFHHSSGNSRIKKCKGKSFKKTPEEKRQARHTNCFKPYKESDKEKLIMAKLSSQQKTQILSAPPPLSVYLSPMKNSILKSPEGGGKNYKSTKNSSGAVILQSPKEGRRNRGGGGSNQNLIHNIPKIPIKPMSQRGQEITLLNGLYKVRELEKRERERERELLLEGSSAETNSIGTIRGSEDLAVEEIDFDEDGLDEEPILLKSIDNNKKEKVKKLLIIREKEKKKKLRIEEDIETGINSKDSWNSKPDRLISLHSHSSFVNKINGNNNIPLGLPNNKDSSRDSAYGFSSGESRESTPEKVSNNSRKLIKRGKLTKGIESEGKYKSALSTVASSTNQDYSPVNSAHYISTQNNNKKSDSSKLKSKFSNPINNEKSKDWMNDEKYINFLTAVTEDIVTRNIYTNKGLKSLFKSHIESNKNLELDKMIEMLDRFRMDVGVPKEDSLNTLEFGYGSVSPNSKPYFYGDLKEKVGKEERKGSSKVESIIKQISHEERSSNLHHRLLKNNSSQTQTKAIILSQSSGGEDIKEPSTTIASTSVTNSSSSSSSSSSSCYTNTSSEEEEKTIMTIKKRAENKKENNNSITNTSRILSINNLVTDSSTSAMGIRSRTNTQTSQEDNGEDEIDLYNNNNHLSRDYYAEESFLSSSLENSSNRSRSRSGSASTENSKQSSLSLSEDEIKLALREVGFRSKATQEILSVMNQHQHNSREGRNFNLKKCKSVTRLMEDEISKQISSSRGSKSKYSGF